MPRKFVKSGKFAAIYAARRAKLLADPVAMRAHLSKQREYTNSRRTKNPLERSVEYQKARAKDPDGYKNAGRARMAKWRDANPERARDGYRRWNEANKDKVRNKNHRRRSAVASGGVSKEEWATVVGVWNGLCAYCNRPGDTMDHIIPLARGGRHEAANVAPACMACNSGKRDAMPLEFIWRRAS